ncbi:MAG: DUF2142 domain-containing protein [Solirubrobacteraceae bacterium]
MSIVAARRVEEDASVGPVAAARPRERSPWRGALLLCILVGVVHGFAWTVINPPMQGPDEFTHVDQVDAMARLMGADDFEGTPGPREINLYLTGVPFSAEGSPMWSPRGDEVAREAMTEARWQGGPPGYGVLNPPLYYLMAAVPDRVVAQENLMDRLWAMRLANLLMFAATIAFCFLFVRELLPRHPWAWTVAGLAVALQPLTAFMAGSVSVDNLLFATSAALFYLLARAFRRGLSLGLGTAIGAVAALGLLTKSTTFGFLPGTALAVLVLAVQAWRAGERRRVLGAPAAALAFAVPFWVWLQISAQVLNRPSGATTGGYQAPTERLEYAQTIASYTWQVFFPRLSSMTDQYQDFFATNPPFPAFPQYPLWETWLQGFVGRFGWHQFAFPEWVNIPAAIIFVGLGVLAIRTVWRVTGGLRRHQTQLVAYLLMAAGAFMLVTIAGYGWRASRGGLSFEQARYLLPLLPLYAGVVALAVVGLRERWGHALSAVLVVLAAGHAVGGLVLTLGRYYA